VLEAVPELGRFTLTRSANDIVIAETNCLITVNCGWELVVFCAPVLSPQQRTVFVGGKQELAGLSARL